MVNKTLKTPLIVAVLGTPEHILLQWLAEMERFHALYHKLSALLAVKGTREETCPRSPTYIGQCPLDQLITLQQTMRAELGTLLADAEHWSHRSAAGSPTAHQRLAAHGRILMRLNQRVQSSLQLATALPS